MYLKPLTEECVSGLARAFKSHRASETLLFLAASSSPACRHKASMSSSLYGQWGMLHDRVRFPLVGQLGKKNVLI
jgi:hypothetical protein